MKNEQTSGLFLAISSYAIWGVLPIYWKQLHSVNSLEVLAHRIIWSFVFVLALVVLTGQFKTAMAVFKDRRRLALTALAAVMITLNWGLFIWSIQVGRILESSLGYYINPLVAVIFGVVIFKERLNHWQLAAIGSASLGVLVLVVEYGQFPWLSFSLAISFGLYGALKKLVQTPSMVGLALETAFLLPLALIWVGSRQVNGTGALGHSTLLVTVFLLLAGMITAIPLLLFAESTRKIPLSWVGMTQYISPTLMFILGVFLYHEPFRPIQAVSFAFIWLALILYTASQFLPQKSLKRQD